jgi:phage shock protein A
MNEEITPQESTAEETLWLEQRLDRMESQLQSLSTLLQNSHQNPNVDSEKLEQQIREKQTKIDELTQRLEQLTNPPQPEPQPDLSNRKPSQSDQSAEADPLAAKTKLQRRLRPL